MCLGDFVELERLTDLTCTFRFLTPGMGFGTRFEDPSEA
jgi:hypothetical protein